MADERTNFTQQFRTVVEWVKESRYWREWLSAFALYAVAYAIGETVNPPDRYIPEPDGVEDPSLSYPKHASIVPDSVLFILISVGPPVFGLVGLPFGGISWVDVHHVCLSCAQSLSLAALIKRTIASLVGRHRPCWYEIIAANPSDARHAKLSYPSGHAAYTFASMTVLSMFLLGKMRVFHRSDLQLVYLVAALLPAFVATFVAISRLMDYHHNFSDINAGAFIGMVTAVFGYHLNYPPVWAKTCGVANTRSVQTVSLSHTEADATPLRAAEEEDEYTRMEPREQRYQAMRNTSS